MYALLGKVPVALEAFARALELEDRIQEKVSRRSALKDVKDYADRVLETDPKNADALAVRALYFLRFRQPDAARADAAAALQIRPGHRRAQAVLDAVAQARGGSR
jgi:hypothetical protein